MGETKLEMLQRPAPERGFDTPEFEARTAKAQEKMDRLGIGAMLLSTEAEVRYYSGFHTPFWQSPTRPWFLVIPLQGKPVAVIPGIGAACWERTWIEDIRTWPAPQPDDDGVTLLAETLREIAGAHGKIGTPMGHETHVRVPAADFDRLRTQVGANRFVDATEIVRTQRMVKSAAEIEKIAHICAIASDAFKAFPKFVQIGDTERQAFARMRIELLQRGADEVPYLVGSSGPGGFADVIKQPTNRILGAGDMMMLDTGAVFDGYFCDFDRNYAFGHATDEMRRAYDVVYAATEAGIAAAVPGATAADLFHAMARVMAASGASEGDVGRLGHGLGMQLTEWPSHTARDRTVLEPGMVITIEPGMSYGDGFNMLHEENIVIRENGTELLTRRAPEEIPVIRQ
ncbi:M24 family metallopeptidase [Hoeflea sp. TYP-13]|uniref:M24 family metallopeptidase n=1 Tax=Hoeflea sp. TYP-13 TaxID=3230023 RepID=UPI0034C6643B